MADNDKLKAVFSQALGVDPQRVNDSLTFNTIPEWDSVAHMALIAAIENAFDVMLDTDDVIGMSSFATAKEIVARYTEA